MFPALVTWMSFFSGCGSSAAGCLTAFSSKPDGAVPLLVVGVVFFAFSFVVWACAKPIQEVHNAPIPAVEKAKLMPLLVKPILDLTGILKDLRAGGGKGAGGSDG